MANNPNVNKVIYDGTTIMDVTDTTATASDVLSGKKFTLASGAKATGSLVTTEYTAGDGIDITNDVISVVDRMLPVSSPTANNLLLTNADGQAIDSGTNLATINTNIENKKVLVITTSSFSSLPQTITNANITSNMVVVNSVLSNPSAQTGDWTVTTSNGSLSISGSISGTTTLTLYLLEQR